MGFTDEDFMPFGKYKLSRMKDLPRTYLLQLVKDKTIDSRVQEYVESNLEEINRRSDAFVTNPDGVNRRDIRKMYTFCEKIGFPNKKEANFQLKSIQKNAKTDKTPVRSYECEVCGAWHHTSKEK